MRKETITKTYEIYTYDELNEDAKERVRKELTESIIEDRFNWLLQDMCEWLKAHYNLDVDDIDYSLCHCQGDGVSFTKQRVLSYTNLKNRDDYINITLFVTPIILGNGSISTEKSNRIVYIESSMNMKIATVNVDFLSQVLLINQVIAFFLSIIVSKAPPLIREIIAVLLIGHLCIKSQMLSYGLFAIICSIIFR